jgi:ribosomal protein S18 acetylase RimI-like enzyme
LIAVVTNFLQPGYLLQQGSSLDRALLVKFMQQTYRELYPQQSFSHLAQTVDQYFAKDTPLWWVFRESSSDQAAIACLWVGNAVDQVYGDRHAHVFLLYVAPDYRRQGIGQALMRHAEAWAVSRGDRQIGLQVFQANQPALSLYTQLGYRPQSFWMVKSLDHTAMNHPEIEEL